MSVPRPCVTSPPPPTAAPLVVPERLSHPVTRIHPALLVWSLARPASDSTASPTGARCRLHERWLAPAAGTSQGPLARWPAAPAAASPTASPTGLGWLLGPGYGLNRSAVCPAS